MSDTCTDGKYRSQLRYKLLCVHIMPEVVTYPYQWTSKMVSHPPLLRTYMYIGTWSLLVIR